MSYIEYPCIMEHIETGRPVLFFGKGVGVRLIDNQFHADWEDSQFKNITSEYLTSTWGVVESEEHADFIKKLAKANGIPIFYSKEAIEGKEVLFFECSDGFLRLWSDGCADEHLKQIIIPMPPKSDAKSDAKKESPELGEWPMVGDDVVLNGKHHIKLSTKASNHIGCKGVLKSRFKNNENEDVYVIEFPNLDCICVFLGSIEKPKTPEQELRDELIEYLNELGSSARYCFGGNELAADELLKTYNITKKHP